MELKNPILAGFYPDPSICRVDGDFYMVTSSFSFFPGVPIFHSTDLAHWEQIGHVLDRPAQLPLDPMSISGGIFAPTIRYHNGTFYMITTNINHGGNFIVTAADPAGPWSDPHWISGAEGIDPSLFWDDDGKAYYTGTRGFGQTVPKIWCSEIDLERFELVGDKTDLWGGALIDCHAPEAPHLYKKDGCYYLMIAEGGTENNHAVTIARSKTVLGNYEGCPGNPILTHRHLDVNDPISNVGHGDLVELADGSWYMVMLASRIYGGYHKNMGRETFIAPVVWQNGWPHVSPKTGKVEWSYPAPDLPETVPAPKPVRDDFEGDALGLDWNLLGTPVRSIYKLEGSRLKIRTVEAPICPPAGTIFERFSLDDRIDVLGFVGRRQQHMSYDVAVSLDFDPEDKAESAGLILLQNNFQSVRIEKIRHNGRKILRAVQGYIDLEYTVEHNLGAGEYHQAVLGEIEWPSSQVILKIKAREQDLSFFAADESGQETPILEHLDGGFLGSETAGGFIGTYIGLFASGNGQDTGHFAEFDWFDYKGRD